MESRSFTLTLGPSADRRRPLALTPGEDLVGFIASYLGRAVLFLITATSVLAVLLILLFVILRSTPFLREFGVREFLTSRVWRPTADEPVFGALTLIVGSLYVSIAALLFAVPVGILAAVFLSDIVSWKIRNVAKPVVEILAAIPSVAYGFFAVLVSGPVEQETVRFLDRDQRVECFDDPGGDGVADDHQRGRGCDLRAGPGAS
jgi:phosphate transport system permease protein